MSDISICTLESFHKYIKSDSCKTILALVGAGLSLSSGIPTFQSSGGTWKNYTMIDLATPDAFDKNPSLVWQFYAYRRHKALEAYPNAGHKALSALSHNDDINFLTITQNIDGLSQRCHHDKKKLLEFHGSLFDLKCTNFECTYKCTTYDDPLTKSLDSTVYENSDELPTIKNICELPICPVCEEGLLRPGVVWYGEFLPLCLIDKADEFIIRHSVDLILIIGTSHNVWPAASYIDIVKNQGGKIAIFNTVKDETLDKDTANVETWQFIGDCSDTLPIALSPLLSTKKMQNNLT